MNEKDYIICIIFNVIICSLVLFTGTGFRFIQGGSSAAYGNGNGTEQLTKQLVGSQERSIELEQRVIELEQRIERIKESSERAARGIESGIEDSRGTVDKIERLRIIFKVLEECHTDIRNINYLSGGKYDNNSIDEIE